MLISSFLSRSFYVKKRYCLFIHTQPVLFSFSVTHIITTKEFLRRKKQHKNFFSYINKKKFHLRSDFAGTQKKREIKLVSRGEKNN